MNEINKAIGILKNGGIVIFPTDTAFGIGCAVDDEKAVWKLFEIRRRPKDKAVPVLVDSIEMAREYLEEIPNGVLDLMNKYWPGALTIVLPCKIDKVPKLARGGGSTIGVRLPNSSIIQEIIKGVGVPILGSSANFNGEKTPYRFEDLNPDLVTLSDYIIKGSTLARVEPSTNVSTVIDCSVTPWKILRQGAINL